MFRAVASIAVLTAVVALGATEASAQTRTRAGVLTCKVDGGIGLILGSQKATLCIFSPRHGRNERYTGFIRKFGLDIGATKRGVIKWAVLSEGNLAPGSLAGNYVGATAEATVGAGLGANVLIGGNNSTVALQPLSVSGQTGLNLALGVGALELRATQ